MKLVRKLPQFDLRNNYTIFIQVGIILTLIFFLGAFKLQIKTEEKIQKLVQKQEVVNMEEVVQTKHTKLPPPPPRPQVPTEVPNDEVIEDEIININAEIDLDERLTLPPPPADKVEKKEKEKIFIVVEQMPELIGGLAGIQQEIVYPKMALKAGIEGRVYVQFVVNELGEVEDPRVIRGIGGGCDKEALRAVSKARFKPGMQRGHPVRVQYSVPIVFKLEHFEE